MLKKILTTTFTLILTICIWFQPVQAVECDFDPNEEQLNPVVVDDPPVMHYADPGYGDIG